MEPNLLRCSYVSEAAHRRWIGLLDSLAQQLGHPNLDLLCLDIAVVKAGKPPYQGAVTVKVWWADEVAICRRQ